MRTHAIAILRALPLALLALSGGTPGLAQVDGRANTSKEGSLLVWPLVQTLGTGETWVTVANNAAGRVLVQCSWEVEQARTDPASPSLLAGFALPLGAFTPATFRASDGAGLDGRAVAVGMGRGEEGALRCWAVDPSGRRQISWNHLGGTAVVVDRDDTAPGAAGPPTTGWEYSAWRFAANVIDSSGAWADGFWPGEVDVAGADGVIANRLNLKASPTTVVDPATCPGPDYAAAGCALPNAAYDACPKYLSFGFPANTSRLAGTDGFAFSSAALVPCKADLTGATAELPTRLVFSLWNERSVQVSGLSRCVNGGSRSDLGALSILRGRKVFRHASLNTASGRFRVDARAGGACGEEAVATPLLGVIWSRLADGTGVVGTAGSASGSETTGWGYVRWLPGGAYYQRSGAPSLRAASRIAGP